MAERLLLHIGTQKSGTTYLQRALAHLSTDLATRGVLYPTQLHGRRHVHNHEAAGYGLLGTAAFPWVSESRAGAQTQAWERLRQRVSEWDGIAIISGEAFSVIDPASARRLVDSLGVADTHVVITARDLARVLPSSWQQHIRNGRSTSFATYLAQLAERRGEGEMRELLRRWNDDPDQTFWRAYAIGGLVERWAPLASRVSVVTVPQRGAAPDELWRRFRHALDLETTLPEAPPVIDGIAANVGLTEPEVLVLAALNRQVDPDKADSADMRSLRSELVRDAFTTRNERGAPVRIPAKWMPTISSWAADDLALLQSTDAVVVGSHSDLAVDATDQRGGKGTSVEDVAAAAGAALALLAGLGSRGPAHP